MSNGTVRLFRLSLLVVCVSFGISMFVLTVIVLPKLDDTVTANAQTTVAVCALREDLQERVDGGVKFLADHPDGAFGLSAKSIQDSIANQQRTVSALHALHCP